MSNTICKAGRNCREYELCVYCLPS